MPGPVPGIHVLCPIKGMDGRDIAVRTTAFFEPLCPARPQDFYPAPLDPLFLLCFYPFRQAHERASSRDVPMMEPPPRKGGPLRGRPRNGGAAPAAGGGRTLRARAAPGHRSPALRPAARSSLMVRATRESGSAARSAARRRTTPLVARRLARRIRATGCAPQGKAAPSGAPHPLASRGSGVQRHDRRTRRLDKQHGRRRAPVSRAPLFDNRIANRRRGLIPNMSVF